MPNSKMTTLILLGLIVAIVLAPETPLFRQLPGLDSGVYGYIGWRILQGEIPYRDVWDHKTPGIYYIDALGLLIGHDSMWGIWALELFSLYAATLLGYVLLKRSFGVNVAALSTIVWLLTLVLVLGGGNRPEEFALPFQFGAWYLFWQSEREGRYGWRSYLLGLIGAAAFLLKQNAIGIWLSIAVYLVVVRTVSRRWRSLVTDLFGMFFGVASLLLVAVGYFASQHAMPRVWDAVVRFNLVYSSQPLAAHLKTILYGFQLTAQSALIFIGLAAWAAGMMSLWWARDSIGDPKSLLHLALIALPVEIVLAAIPGQELGHYYIAWLPVLAILSGFFFRAGLANVVFDLRTLFETRRPSMSVIWWTAALIAMSGLPMVNLAGQMGIWGRTEDTTYQTAREAIDYVESHTTPDESVLVWGGATRVNFVARRRSPVRFTYQYPLYMPGYRSAEMIHEFLHDLSANQPALIIDNLTSLGALGPTDFAERQRWRWDVSAYVPLPEMSEVVDYISANYRYVRTVGKEKWLVYARVNGS